MENKINNNLLLNILLYPKSSLLITLSFSHTTILLLKMSTTEFVYEIPILEDDSEDEEYQEPMVKIFPDQKTPNKYTNKNKTSGNEQGQNQHATKKANGTYSNHYRCITKRTKVGKPYRMEYYVTKNITGNPIHNALTNSVYRNYTVGSMYENLFFKIHFCTKDSYQSQYESAQYKKKSPIPAVYTQKEDPDILFYDSPEEYESHHGVELSHDLKANWRSRYEKLCAFLAKKEQEQLEKEQRNQYYRNVSAVGGIGIVDVSDAVQVK